MERLNLRQLVLVSASLLSAVSLWSCGVIDWIIGGNIDVNGARATISQERAKAGGTNAGYILLGTQNQFRKVDVVSLLTGGQDCTSPIIYDSEQQQTCIEWAFSCFDNYPPNRCPQPVGTSVSSQPTPTPPNPDDQKVRRNQVQERLIAASNSACREFTQHLNTYQSYTNFLLGTAAVGTGAAGAIVSSAVAASALAGVTGALAGTRAEFNADIFAKQVVATIVQAIDKSREDYLLKLRGTDVEGAAQPATPTPKPTPTSTPAGGGGEKPNPKQSAGENGSEKNPAATIAGKQSLSIEKIFGRGGHRRRHLL